jgi:PAS domain S-box-containing protein
VPLAVIAALLAVYLRAAWLPHLDADAESEHLRLVERHLDSVAEGLVPLLLARQLDTVHESLSALLEKNDDWIAVVLTDPAGRQLYPLPGRTLRTARADQRPRVLEMPIALDGERLGQLAVTVDLAPGLAFGRQRSAELRWLLLAIAVVVLVTVVATLEAAVLRPLRQLARAAGALAHQRFDAALPPPRRDEVGSLVRSFAAMREELRSYHGRLLREIAVRSEAERALRRRTEELEEREAFFRAVLLNSPAVSFVLGPDRKVRFVSTSARTLLGWSDGELPELSPIELVHPEDRAATAEAFARLRAGTERTARVTCRVRRKDGSFCAMDVLGSNLLDDPHVHGLVMNARDVTAELLLQEQLLQAQKLESVGRLAGGVAHDFNNLLTVVLGSTELLAQDLADAPAADRELLDEIQGAGERARALTRQLLAFARRQVIAPVPLDLGEVVRGAEKLLRRLLGESIELRLASEPGLWPVRCDPGHLEQVIMNLTVNARDAMPEGGQLRIETANVPGEAPTWSDQVRLRVQDTGVGIAPEVKARLFEPFFTTKPQGKGTGLGLATVYGIVTQSNGRISVTSAPGAGATFELLFPRHLEASASDAPVPAPAVRDHAGTETILLVEDDRAVRELASRALNRAGYRVLEAADAPAALSLGADPAIPFDLLVVDIGLPGMRGTRVAEAMVRTRPGLPVLYVSGHIEESADRNEVVQVGKSFLPKPFTPTALLDRIRALLDERPRTGTAAPPAA